MGLRLKNYRKFSLIKIIDLSKELGVSAKTIYNWESGDNFPSIDLLARLSSKYNISLDYIVFGRIKDKMILEESEVEVIEDIITTFYNFMGKYHALLKENDVNDDSWIESTKNITEKCKYILDLIEDIK